MASPVVRRPSSPYRAELTPLVDGQFTNMTYTPPVPHARPALLQAVVSLPPHATLRMNMDARKSFLRYTEHPPDAQRGWDLPPAVFVPRDANASSQERHWGGARRVYTPVILVDLATPDFSMPYNVIIMSCTLIALIFGSLFNLLTRKFAVIHVGEEKVGDTGKETRAESSLQQ
ncbi:hypothetical protein EWM64_g4001 [Hericium alpestre]|uniref:Uncharacterized protein n=1 Tax=Hericium alpestre TaxID=135208 RepID=A0A4Z0A0P1_9AGAM|nr:hypothetical protein EWM64_g4001 [Hericium alpestre]